MNIAIEAFTLSAENLTGIGKVTSKYVQKLLNCDAENNYYLYIIDSLRNIEIDHPRWKILPYVHEKSALKKRIRTRLEQLSASKMTPAGLCQYLALRPFKMLLELRDRISYKFHFEYSFKKYNIDLMIIFSPHVYPRFIFKHPMVIGMIYDLVWELFPETMEWKSSIRSRIFTNRHLKKMDLIVSISDSTKHDAMRLLGIKKPIHVIPLAADPSIFYRAPQRSVERVKKRYNIKKNYILSVATLEPRKNLTSLIQAYGMMLQRDSLNLVLVGMTGWIENEFFISLKKNSYYDNIILTGYVPEEDLAPLYTGARMFVFPSLYEGFGMPILEAMQCGCPVITSNTSSMPEVAGNAAIFVKPCDTAGIAWAMDELATNALLRKKLTIMGQERAREFSWEKSTEQLRALFK